MTSPSSPIADAAARRRTFAIISHPDAGKTTLTEKLLLFGGAIHLAGEVRAKGERRRARSDWMKIEQQRGISVTTSVMTFEYAGCTFNLLDTPGHEDFSEDTYRTLTAVDSAIMVLDAAKGIEPQTLKLFEVCRLRDIPIMTFINKMDREAKDPVELLDEIHDRLALDIAPMNWPIGMGQNFKGVFDRASRDLVLLGEGNGLSSEDVVRLDSNSLPTRVPEGQLAELREQLDLVEGALPAFDLASYRQGHLSPAFFGSALRNFGVRALLDGLANFAPVAAAAAGRAAHRGARRGQGHRLRLQGPGQHGPQAPRPGGVRAPVLRPVPARHEAQHGAAHQADRGRQPDLLLRPRARDRRGGLARRHHRRAQPRPAPGRRHALRGRADPVHRHPQLRARDPDAHPAGRPDAGQAPEGGAGGSGRGGGHPGVPARSSVPNGSWAWSASCSSTCCARGSRPSTICRSISSPPPTSPPAGATPTTPGELDQFVQAKKASLATDRDGNPVYLARNGWDLGRVQEDFPKVRFTATRERH